MVPVVLSVLGFGFSFWIGMNRFGHTAGEVLWALVATQIGAAIALPLTLYAQRTAKLRFLVKGPLRSWTMLMGVSVGSIMVLCPWCRDLGQFAWMFVPLFFSVALMVLFWGPIHDRVVMGRR
jgi:hypothetical protein